MSESVATAPVESSTPAPSVSLDSLDTTQYDHWRSTGELPDNQKPAEPSTEAASSPAEPGDQAASTDATQPPASEPGTPKKNNAETRIKELLAENARIKAEMESLRARPSEPQTEAASSPASQSPDIEATIQSPDLSKPMLKDEAFYAQHPEASISDYLRYVARYEHGAATNAQQSRQRHLSRQQFYGTAAAKALESYPDLEAKVPQVLQDAYPVELLPPGTPPSAANYAMQEIWHSPDPGKLLLHIADHPDVLKEIQQATAPVDVVRTIARLQARLDASVTPPAPAGDPVSLAPKPTPTLGKKPAQPADPLEDAIRTGDFARYKELTDAKELSKRSA